MQDALCDMSRSSRLTLFETVPDRAISIPSHLEDLLYHAMLWPTALQEQEMMPPRDPKHDIEPLAISSPYENAKAKC